MRYWRPHRHYHDPQRAYDRWLGETLQGMPTISYAERHAPGATFPDPREVAYFAERRALLPPEVKVWRAERVAAAQGRPTTQRRSTPTPKDRPKGAERLTNDRPAAQGRSTLTPLERRQRKLEQTRASNARKRAERKLLGLPHL